jgi:hypothetical protein
MDLPKGSPSQLREGLATFLDLMDGDATQEKPTA